MKAALADVAEHLAAVVVCPAAAGLPAQLRMERRLVQLLLLVRSLRVVHLVREVALAG